MLLMLTVGAVAGGAAIGIYKRLSSEKRSAPRLSELVAAKGNIVTRPKSKSDTPLTTANEFVQLELDQLEAIHGIGPTYARRLNEAGIFTYQDLADTPEDQLAQIVAPDGMRVPPVSRWIQAAQTVGGQST